MNPQADRVRAERLSRGWSVRDAARASGISNTWWGRFEDGIQPLTDGIVAGVAQAFGWPAEWPTVNPPADDQPVTRQELEALKESLQSLTDRVGGLQAQWLVAVEAAVDQAERRGAVRSGPARAGKS